MHFSPEVMAMVYDPAWSMPQINWQQQGSFVEGQIPLVDEPDAEPLVCLPRINVHWLPLVLGCLDQLRNPSTWIASDDAAMSAILSKSMRLMQMMAGRVCVCPMLRLQDCVLQISCDDGSTWTDVTGWSDNFGPCVLGITIPPVPPNPGDLIPSQRACNIAGFIAKDVVQLVIQKAVSNYHDDLTLLEFGLAVFATISFAFPLTAFAVDVFYAVYLEITAMNIADFDAAATDPLLVSLLTCEIYNAIKDTGYITADNLPVLISNVCTMPYTYPTVTHAICVFFEGIGLKNLEAMQSVGALDAVDCSGCGESWCREWNITHADLCGGDWLVVGAGTGICTSGVWTGQFVGSFFDLGIYAGPGSSFEITAYDISASFTSTVTIDFRLAGVNVGHFTTTVASFATITADQMIIQIGSTDGAPQITSISASGPGSNPFGLNNCS